VTETVTVTVTVIEAVMASVGISKADSPAAEILVAADRAKAAILVSLPSSSSRRRLGTTAA
jgi:hypothetical protein